MVHVVRRSEALANVLIPLYARTLENQERPKLQVTSVLL